jgi:acetyl/propionyl-CoA carboxylase alpha subunit
MDNAKFIEGDLSTSFLTEEYPEGKYHELTEAERETAAIAAAIHKLTSERKPALDRDQAGPQCSGWVRTHRRDNVRWFGGSK